MIYIGTAGFSYDDWIGPFYPEGIKGSEMLEFYSREFDFVELNSTYYHMPSLKLFVSMDRKTPEKFMFAVKLFKGFTHERTSGKEDAQRFMFALQPLIEKGKLLCILVQFPYSFHYNSENVEYIKNLRKMFGNDINMNVEFRNRVWVRKETVVLLRGEGLGFVCVDEPDIKGLMGKVTAITSDISYVRFHGRNKTAWYGTTGSERYDYMYSREELLEWMPTIREMTTKSGITVISFNNHPIGKAIESARLMKELTAQLL